MLTWPARETTASQESMKALGDVAPLVEVAPGDGEGEVCPPGSPAVITKRYSSSKRLRDLEGLREEGASRRRGPRYLPEDLAPPPLRPPPVEELVSPGFRRSLRRQEPDVPRPGGGAAPRSRGSSRLSCRGEGGQGSGSLAEVPEGAPDRDAGPRTGARPILGGRPGRGDEPELVEYRDRPYPQKPRGKRRSRRPSR